VQAKFGQYLQDAKNPRSISQTEKAVEREQIRSNEQILPTPALGVTLSIEKIIGNSSFQKNFGRKSEPCSRYCINFLSMMYGTTRPIIEGIEVVSEESCLKLFCIE
jgi:hypothetical protein